MLNFNFELSQAMHASLSLKYALDSEQRKGVNLNAFKLILPILNTFLSHRKNPLKSFLPLPFTHSVLTMRIRREKI